MHSSPSTQRLFKFDLDPFLLKKDLDQIKSSIFLNDYREYSIGEWKTAVLANRSGNDQHGLSEEYDGFAQWTPLSRSFPYLQNLVEGFFHWDKIKSVRLFKAGKNGIIIPHRDYLEFRSGFKRVHIPILCGERSFNSQDDLLFQMKLGEVWFLDAHSIHSGGSFDEGGKMNLVIDFDPSYTFSQLLKDPSKIDLETPQPLTRKPLTRSTLQSLFKLKDVIDESNFDEILSLLAKIHYFYQSHCGDMYTWLEKICQESEKKELIQKSHDLRQKFLGELT